jgi:tetratricopeptide (TPR) repeat protein
MVTQVLTDVLKSKFELQGNMMDLLRAIEMSEKAVEQASPADEGRADFRCALSFLYEMKYGHTLDVEDLEWAVYHGEAAVAAVPIDHKNYGLHQHNLGDKLSSLYQRTGLKDHLDRAMTAAQQAVIVTPLDHPNRPGYLNNLASCASRIAKLSGLRSDAERALRLAQEVVDTCAPEEWRYPMYLTNLGNRHSDMYKFTSNIEDIDKSIRFGRLTLEQEAANDKVSKGLPGHMSNLAASLFYRYEKTSSQNDLRQAIDMQKAALGLLSPTPNAERAIILGNLCSFLETQYKLSRDIIDLEEAIQCARGAVDGSLTGSPDEGDHLEKLSRLLATRFKHTSDPKDLEEAERQAEKAVTAPVYEDGDDKSRWVIYSHLANTIASHFSLERTLTADNVDRAYWMAQRAVSQFPEIDSRRPALLNNLANVLQHRFRRSNSQHDLETAISLVQEGLATMGANKEDRAMLLSNLSYYLSLKYDYTSFRSQLEDCVLLAEEALKVAKEQNISDMTRYYDGLSTALEKRHEKFGNIRDVERAVSLSEEAVAAAPPGHKGKLAKMQHNASLKLSTKARTRLGTLVDMERAIELAEKAVAAMPEGHHHLPKYRRSLANHYVLRFDMKGDMADLDSAIGLIEEILASVPQGHLHRPGFLECLSIHYQWKFEAIHQAQLPPTTSNGDKEGTETIAKTVQGVSDHPNDRAEAIQYLDRAIELSLEAVNACRDDDWDLARLLKHLGDRLRQRVPLTQSDDDIDDCVRAYDLALKADLAAPRDRISAARSAASVCMQAGGVLKASDFLDQAMSIVPKVHTRTPERDDEYDQAADYRNLASDAAAIALAAGKKPYAALSLLESGNAVIIGSTIDYRSDVSDLYASHPAIAEDFEKTRRAIDSPEISSNSRDLSNDLLRDRYGPVATGRRAAVEHLEELLLTIRDLPGHENFLLPPAEGRLLELAASGPIVILNSSFMATRADAIVVTTKSIESVYLVEATKQGFYKPSREAIDAGPEAKEFTLETDVLRGGLRTRAKRNETLGALLKYTWKTFIQPVCSFLESELKFDPEKLPHITWIRVGMPFNQIPIHAVGDTKGGPRANVYSRMVSTYAPSIKALIYARERAFSFLDIPDPRLLVATMETTPGTPACLPGVKDEVDAIRKVIHNRILTTDLPQPSAQVVLDELSKSQAVHFACHGFSDTSNPSNNSLIFSKTNNEGKEVADPLRVRDISMSNHSSRTDMQLAYLSACSGASIDIQALADEAVHMASGFLLAGFSHIIATLWNVQDDVCVDMAREFYKYLLMGMDEPEGRIERHQRVSWALHKALEPVRKEYIDEPLVWAPFIHIGA